MRGEAKGRNNNKEEIMSLNYLVHPALSTKKLQFKYFHSEKAHNLTEQELEGEEIHCVRLAKEIYSSRTIYHHFSFRRKDFLPLS